MSFPPPDDGTSKAILADIEEARGDLSDKHLAAWLGCDVSRVSHIRAGRQGFRADELRRLIRRVGAPVVLRELADLDGCDVVPREAEPTEPLPKAIELSDKITSMTLALSRTMADGTVDAVELADLERRYREIGEGLEQLRAGWRARA